MIKHPIYQDVWSQRAVNQERSPKQDNGHREGSKVQFSQVTSSLPPS